MENKQNKNNNKGLEDNINLTDKKKNGRENLIGMTAHHCVRVIRAERGRVQSQIRGQLS